MSTTVRFAPSPTGRLHIGNVRTAILNWLFARKSGGTFLLRLDDTDAERSKAEFVDAIQTDLQWLGLRWDRLERQSDRAARYAEVAATLKRGGRLYPCYETEDELDRRRKRQMARGRPPIYDRAGLRMAAEERAELEAEGRRPHWRFRLNNTGPAEPLEPLPTLVHWVDLIRGDQSVDVGSLSDPVLVREDGTVLYTFSSVVDDIDFGVTHIIRGEDHVTNTGVQVQLFEAIGAQPPAFAHHSLLVDGQGQALSKRLGHLSVEGLRSAGLEPMAIASLAALVGTSQAIEAVPSLDALVQSFGLDKLARAPARFDIEELKVLNARLLHQTPFEQVADRLAELGMPADAGFWEAVRANVVILADARVWWDVVHSAIAPIIENAATCAAAISVLPLEPWDATTWSTWTKAISQKTGLKGRALYHPLRMALTGREQGPEMRLLLPLIGHARAVARLEGRAA